MSTKCTIRHGDRWHLYEECLEDTGVYLELENVEIQLSSCGNNNNIIIRLDNELALETGIITKDEVPRKIDWTNLGKNFPSKK